VTRNKCEAFMSASLVEVRTLAYRNCSFAAASGAPRSR